ncbi:MAG: alpha/beta hydrolase [Candidatus Paceibacterota bacterium]
MEQFVLVKKAENSLHKTPLVLVHGSWGSSMMWMLYIKHFVEKGWDVYAPDLRGHGKSGGSVDGATMDDYVSDVKRMVDEHNLKTPLIIGHSMGGLVSLIYATHYGARAVVALDPSPSQEVRGAGEKKDYPPAYTPTDAGMPQDPKEIMSALPDIPQEKLASMKEMLGVESGVARSERKLGISIPKETLSLPTLFVGGELGESLPFGIGIKTAQEMARYYEKEVLEIKGATHPGILIGTHAKEAVRHIEEWLRAHE